MSLPLSKLHVRVTNGEFFVEHVSPDVWGTLYIVFAVYAALMLAVPLTLLAGCVMSLYYERRERFARTPPAG